MSSASDYYIPEIERLSALVRKLRHEREALIDPNDPAVRERIIKAVRIALPQVPAFAVGDVADTVIAWLRDEGIAALRSKP